MNHIQRHMKTLMRIEDALTQRYGYVLYQGEDEEDPEPTEATESLSQALSDVGTWDVWVRVSDGEKCVGGMYFVLSNDSEEILADGFGAAIDTAEEVIEFE